MGFTTTTIIIIVVASVPHLFQRRDRGIARQNDRL
jgi:hypothetical protein